MVKPPLIIFDLDDCLLHYTKHYVAWVFTTKFTSIDTHNTTTWYAPEFIYEFNHSDYFTQRDKLPLYQTFRGLHLATKNLAVLTACGRGLESAVAKALGISHEFILCVGSSNDKYEVLSEVRGMYDILMVDDKQDTIEWCERAKIPSILANQDIDKVNEVIYNHIGENHGK